ncbi:MAG: TIGR01459 family HAD-type hydrolase [Sediminimonas qiaohouensis]|uniref:TIGR01459 family HAD-type hydrolase n=1 Tax=Sediminimonas qiaohouensis TaxID=552061 RepID=A0A7C9HBC8_9RHOB|nr:TIGR01459 family HAD-type hydrolase [Sediminimonas qiaohouensis]MTJ04930.1 TIGR01459 family HAD-type hydrolase [Sediminimonas qiaohouensis]
MTQIISALSEVSARYQAAFVDLWGCVHDGVRAIPSAVEALRAYRASGGTVVLLTNSPRPRKGVEAQLDQFGVPHGAWDTIATSGDSARAAMFRGVVGNNVFFIGEERDLPFFEPMHVIENPAEIHLTPLDQADGIVCTGPFDAMADLAVLRPQLLLAKQRGLKLLCANPDIVVDRGDHREWCAGAVARLYTEMGGESLYFGKPHPPIYDLAYRRLAELGRDVARQSILAIGDGTQTDIAGAMGEDLDSLFITGGLARVETETAAHPDAEALERYLASESVAPTFAMGQLA